MSKSKSPRPFHFEYGATDENPLGEFFPTIVYHGHRSKKRSPRIPAAVRQLAELGIVLEKVGSQWEAHLDHRSDSLAKLPPLPAGIEYSTGTTCIFERLADVNCSLADFHQHTSAFEGASR